jgi:hypothetical protein
MSYADHIDTHNGEMFRPKPVTLQQLLPNHKFKLMEDEDNEKSS